MKEFEFNKQEKTAIAEFIFSEQTDVLIKSDAIDVVVVLTNHEIITQEEQDNFVKEINQNVGVVISKIKLLLSKKISNRQGSEIMDEYYGKSSKTPQKS